MTDEHTIAALREARSTVVRDHHLAPEVAAAAWDSAHARRHPGRRHLAVAASVAGVAGAAIALAVWNSGTHSHNNAAGDRSVCAGTVTTAPLPTWARAGFTRAGLHTPHVVSDHDQMIAALFGPLRVHQPAGIHNKVLWVARAGSGPLHIHAQRQGTSQTVTTELPNGPGPSYVNMPSAGCWQMSLTWSQYHDTIALQYQP